MPDIYLILVIVLFVLAITDLVVGVSNDAVNFLNSAVGSKVAPLKWVMIVASLGVFVGATFSSGMMEVARKSIFHPEAFSFAEIMILFVAVMLTDIILLDLFNSIGMPTSTTVSIVFELLGAATVIALFKMTTADEGLGHLNQYINGDTALTIVIGILLSVVFAFLFGAVIQYLSRLLFTFQYKKRYKYFGSIWAGLALTAMTYFLLIKGLKHASFISVENATWIKENTLTVLGVSMVFWTLLLQALASFTKFNGLKIVVMFGTFALAMAFAGNDLVNFIGVPIAGLESYFTYSGQSLPADELMMTSLAEPVKTNTWLLLAAGAIMVVTLWMSKKARSVVETSIKLSQQTAGTERFRPNFLSQSLVRFSYWVSSGLVKTIPENARKKIDNAFQAAPLSNHHGDAVAFDLIRASVNLAVASMLISFATSLKLPLSTTYVTFMVAMGASLADRAWGRDSAVYRVAGVVQVVAGWFGTALIAFTVCGIFALMIMSLGLWVVGVLVLLAIGLMVRSNLAHKKRSEKHAKMDAAELEKDSLGSLEITNLIKRQVKETLAASKISAEDAFQGLITENLEDLRKSKKDVEELLARNNQMRISLFHLIKRSDTASSDMAHQYVKVFDLVQDLTQSIELVVNSCSSHIENVHLPLDDVQKGTIANISGKIADFFSSIGDEFGENNLSKDIEPALYQEKKEILGAIEDCIRHQNEGIRTGQYNSRNSLLIFSLMLEAKDLVAIAYRFLKLSQSNLDEKDEVAGTPN